MDLTRLRYFCMIAQSGSLRAASELLLISPAALSKSLKLLEEEAGLKLVTPSGRGLALTSSGKLLAVQGQELLDSAAQLKARLHHQNDSKPPMRLGSFEVFTTYLLGPLLKELYGNNEPKLTIHELIPGQLEQALAENKIDLGITYLPVPHAEIEHLKVASVQMGVFARKGSFKGMRFEDIPFAVPVEPIHGSPNKVQGLDGWPENKFRRNVRYKVTLMESALELCRQGMAAAYLPLFVTQLHNRQVQESFELHRLSEPREARTKAQNVYLVKRKSDAETKLVRRVARALRLICC